MKKTFGIVVIALVLLLGVLLIRTFTFKSKQVQEPQMQLLKLDNACIGRFQQAIRIKTISYDDPAKIDSAAFFTFQNFLTENYPLCFSQMAVEKVNTFSLILHWKGKSSEMKPVVLMAHQDVVPIEDATKDKWDAEPFSGEIKDGFIYGRGTIDDKGSLIALLEATEILQQQGFVPARDIYFVFGHDEEVMGLKGAKAIADLFKERKIQPAFVLDEGGIITASKVPGLSGTAAVVGIAEKGYQTLQLKINIPGGHSSMPRANTAIDEMAKAIVDLKDSPFPSYLSPVVKNFLAYVGPEMPFVSKMAMANQWLFAPMIKNTYSKSATGNATIRTTTATTIFNAGIKENLIPGEAEATVNFRTQPGITRQEVIDHVKKVIANDQIQISPIGDGNEPNQVADVNDESFKLLQKTIGAFHKGIVVAPYLVLGATDGRYFGDLTSQVFRFIPFTDPEGFHGVNERIKVEEFKKGISFYYQLIRNL